jgi:hypothetical protein
MYRDNGVLEGATTTRYFFSHSGHHFSEKNIIFLSQQITINISIDRFFSQPNRASVLRHLPPIFFSNKAMASLSSP